MKVHEHVAKFFVYVTVYSFIFILVQLVCLIVGVMNLIRCIILLCMGTLCKYVFFYFDKACLYLIAGVMNLVRYVILLCMGTLYNCIFCFDKAHLFGNRNDESNEVRDTFMYGYIM